jgi:hypothetical protein
MAFNITPPISISHLFGNWLNGIIKAEKIYIRVGVYGPYDTLSLTKQNFHQTL